MELVEIIRVENILGEGIVWDVPAQCIWWTDIHGRHLYRHSWPSTAAPRVYELPERLCSFGLRDGQAGLVAAFESGIALFYPETGRTEWLMRLPAMAAKVRFNDGRVDRQSRFWCGTMVEDQRDLRSRLGQLFCVETDGTVTCRLDGIMISNGICWNVESTRFYFADTPRREIHEFDFDAATGAIANRRVFVKTPEGAYPDGADIDSEGFMWSAEWAGGRIVRYSASGAIDRTVGVPVSQPTCVAFGGPKLRHLFVTSAREHLSDQALAKEPQAGNVFVFEGEVIGIAASRCAL